MSLLFVSVGYNSFAQRESTETEIVPLSKTSNVGLSNVLDFGHGSQTSILKFRNFSFTNFPPSATAKIDIINVSITKVFDIKKFTILSPMARVKWVDAGIFYGSSKGYYISPMNLGLGFRLRFNDNINLQPSFNFAYGLTRSNEKWVESWNLYPEVKLNIGQISIGFAYGVYFSQGDLSPFVESVETTAWNVTMGVLF